MVSAIMAACLLVGLSSGDGEGDGSGPSIRPAPASAASAGDASTPARTALKRGNYPWYDPKTDSVTPVWPRDPDLDSSKQQSGAPSGWGIASLGDLLAIGLAMLALATFVTVLVVLWRRYRPEVEPEAGATIRPGSSARIEDLPAGVRPETADPWAEALARRGRGDYAGAIICLFAHQLLTLDRLRLIRLVPGRTGRQYVRAIDDRQVRAWVEPTLRLFEAVYYGHRGPSVEAFERAWEQAEAFERHVAAGAVA